MHPRARLEYRPQRLDRGLRSRKSDSESRAALGSPELAEDPRFQNNRTRLEYRDDLTEIIEQWMSAFETDEEVVAILEQHRVPCGPVVEPVN